MRPTCRWSRYASPPRNRRAKPASERPLLTSVARTRCRKTIFPKLAVSTEKLCFIIEKAREFDVKDVVTDPDDASNPTDDANLAVLEDHKDDPVVKELSAVINSMSVDEQIDLVTLTWIGRGDGGIEELGRLTRRSQHAPTTAAPRLICWAFLCSPTISTKLFRCSVFPARKVNARPGTLSRANALWRAQVGLNFAVLANRVRPESRCGTLPP